MTLRDAQVGSTVVVTKIEGDSAYKRRIMDMGITKGSELYIRKVAPLGDPVEITVRGYELTVRKDDAQCVQVITAAFLQRDSGGKRRWQLELRLPVTRTVVKQPCSTR